VREWCNLNTRKQTRCPDLYDAYVRWTKDAGRGKMGRNRFYEEFQRAYPKCEKARIRSALFGENPVNVFSGVEVRDEYAPQWP